MKKFFLIFFLFLFAVHAFAQQDSIYIEGKLSKDFKTLKVSQDIVYFNKSNDEIFEVKLLNWIAAYKNEGSALADRKLEDRDKDLHFAKKEELGKLENLVVTVDERNSTTLQNFTEENLFFALNKNLKPNESVNIHLEYTLILPAKNFTGYGTSNNQVALKYFFLVPDSFEENSKKKTEFNNIEETSNFNTFWTINLDLPNSEFSESNLVQIHPNYFQGQLKTNPEIFISKAPIQKINVPLNNKNVSIAFGYNISKNDLENLEFYAPLHLKFIAERTGSIPQKIFINDKFKNKEEFLGNDDIKFWKFHFPLFTPAEQIDLDYFSILSQKVMEESFIVDKNKNHWWTNGLQTYLEMQYLKKFYAENKLLGLLPEAKFLGIKPLKFFHASDLNLKERYGIAYQYMMTQNLDQKIEESFTKLSNFNNMAISNFETGTLFNFVAEKMGEKQFDEFLKNYLENNDRSVIDSEDFLNKLSIESKNSSQFLKNYIREKQRVNFKVKSFKRKEGNLELRIKKNSKLPVPFKLETYSENGDVKIKWYETEAGNTDKTYKIPDSAVYKIVVNDKRSFPETSLRDNYLYTKGFFSNMKKIKIKLIKDIPNPEYNEIYLNPRIKFNAYDKILLGLNFKNESLFEQNLEYSITPYFSTGTGQIAGSAGVVYKIMPPESFFRTLDLGVSGSYFHYDYDLSYQKYSVYAAMDLSKNPRSAIARSFSLSYNHFEKDLTPSMISNKEYDRYNLINAGFGYSDNKLIHEKYFSVNYQLMEDFNKLSAEGFYRWEFAENKKMSVRLFAGYFLENNTRNDIFDFGISKVSNYSFSYGLVGQSATSGLLSQQYIQADGGFKSYINGTANQWITSVNADTHVWKLFHIYADVGVYKNKGNEPKFIYDTGVKLRIVPDFLEIYLPVYSTLGFEPGFKDYASRIRFSLVLNFNALVNTLRRGWY